MPCCFASEPKRDTTFFTRAFLKDCLIPLHIHLHSVRKTANTDLALRKTQEENKTLNPPSSGQSLANEASTQNEQHLSEPNHSQERNEDNGSDGQCSTTV